MSVHGSTTKNFSSHLIEPAPRSVDVSGMSIEMQSTHEYMLSCRTKLCQLLCLKKRGRTLEEYQPTCIGRWTGRAWRTL